MVIDNNEKIILDVFNYFVYCGEWDILWSLHINCGFQGNLLIWFDMKFLANIGLHAYYLATMEIQHHSNPNDKLIGMWNDVNRSKMD